MRYEALTPTEQRANLDAELRRIERDHQFISRMMAAGNYNTDPAQGPTIGPRPHRDDTRTPEQRAKDALDDLDKQHARLKAARSQLG